MTANHLEGLLRSCGSFPQTARLVLRGVLKGQGSSLSSFKFLRLLWVAGRALFLPCKVTVATLEPDSVSATPQGRKGGDTVADRLDLGACAAVVLSSLERVGL